jgi:hypothetical protein
MYILIIKNNIKFICTIINVNQLISLFVINSIQYCIQIIYIHINTLA